jgi:hypothetical protein
LTYHFPEEAIAQLTGRLFQKQHILLLSFSWFFSAWDINFKKGTTTFFNSSYIGILNHTECRVTESVPDPNSVDSG